MFCRQCGNRLEVGSLFCAGCGAPLGSPPVARLLITSPRGSWEQRIDQLMAKQIATLNDTERKQTFTEVQRVFAEHLPAVYFAAPGHRPSHGQGFADRQAAAGL